ncbi:heme exporter protein CcmD [Ferrovibrio terrae]|uniref:heme exporter protein CcmD n=1 Tax=Ferrovibrio terrae TaxID=2594003 RepID=UPI0031384825
MYWASLGDFFAMGGHAAYIWPAFAVALAVLAGLALYSRASLKAAERAYAQARQDAGRTGDQA